MENEKMMNEEWCGMWDVGCSAVKIVTWGKEEEK